MIISTMAMSMMTKFNHNKRQTLSLKGKVQRSLFLNLVFRVSHHQMKANQRSKEALNKRSVNNSQKVKNNQLYQEIL